MMGASGLLLIVVGLLILYAAISGKLDCFAQFFNCLFNNAETA